MRECERKLIRVIRESADPSKTMTMAVDILQRLIAGEDEQSIAVSYGIKPKSMAEPDLCQLCTKPSAHKKAPCVTTGQSIHAKSIVPPNHFGRQKHKRGAYKL